jgi:ribonucleoside-diphosphate reductase alpha chain
VRITADHRVLTRQRGDVPVSQLQAGEYLLLQGAGFGRKALTEPLALAIGVAVGDGCLSSCMTRSGEEQILTLVMAPEESGVLTRIAGEVNRQKATLRATGSVGNPSPAQVSLSTAGGRVSRLSFASRPVVALFKEFAVLDEGSEGKRFTNAVYDLDRPSMAAMLRGLFTADGTVANYTNKSQYVSLDSTSLELLRQVQAMLLSFGIKSKLYQNRPGENREATLPDGRGGMRVYPVQQMHSLRISRSSRVIFEREIGFDPGSLKAAALACLNEQFGAYRDELADPIASIEPLGEEDVFDLTEEVTHHFAANGLIVHNCSEYMFLDDSACNLVSINLIKFLDEEGNFDVDGFRHAVRLCILAQEILVDYSSYPTARIARNSHDYRPLGLGYANLGAMLMVLGIPYDSPEGTAMCGAVTALMTGHAYTVSSEIAMRKGSFTGYPRNAKPFMRVMRKHRDACDRINAEFCPTYLLQAARQAWDDAIALGEQHGYRNAQSTVLAPTGTIGLLMDCDTTGIEPDYALVKFKKLAGGGYFKIVNQSVPRALRRLGYSSQEIQDILQYVNGTMTLRGAPHVNDVALKTRGLDDDDLARLEGALRGSLDLSSLFNVHTLGVDALARLGLSAEQVSDSSQGILRALGFSDAQIQEANERICGTLTVESAPHLRAEHYAVFDCANRCGRKGRRFITPMGHVRMMAAAQPFISGAISKTVNLPHDATVENIRDIYVQGWKMGLKAIALYRDGCKLSQPLSSSHKESKKTSAAAAAFTEAAQKAEAAAAMSVALKPPAPVRRRLPVRRKGLTVEARVAGHKVFLRTGEYEDGTLGEIFIDMHKEGAAFRSMMNCFAIAISKGLQYGVPLKEFVDTFTFTRFEPQGPCDHPNIKMATSVIDYVFRVLALEYLGQAEYCQVKPDEAAEAMDKVLSITESAHEAEAFGENPEAAGASDRSDRSVRSDPSDPSGAPSSAGRARVEEVPVPAAMRAHGYGPESNEAAARPAHGAPAPQSSASGGLRSQMESLMGDAPFCDVCGHITVRNGTCYKCLNCGNSMGCS